MYNPDNIDILTDKLISVFLPMKLPESKEILKSFLIEYRKLIIDDILSCFSTNLMNGIKNE
jgi:hypothetical protein